METSARNRLSCFLSIFFFFFIPYKLEISKLLKTRGEEFKVPEKLKRNQKYHRDFRIGKFRVNFLHFCVRIQMNLKLGIYEEKDCKAKMGMKKRI